RNQFCCVSASVVTVPCRRAGVDLHVAPNRPTRLLQPLRKCSKADLIQRITRGKTQKHADPPHAPALLRARRERPRGCRAAEQCDELASFHCPMPPVLPTGRIARLRTAGDCCIHPTSGGTR